MGEDLPLLETRALLLKDWETVTASSLQANNDLKAQDFDMVLLCHSVRERSARQLIQAALLARSNPIVLAIRLPGESDYLGTETHTMNLYESPAWLPAQVSDLLAKRSAS